MADRFECCMHDAGPGSHEDVASGELQGPLLREQQHGATGGSASTGAAQLLAPMHDTAELIVCSPLACTHACSKWPWLHLLNRVSVRPVLALTLQLPAGHHLNFPALETRAPPLLGSDRSRASQEACRCTPLATAAAAAPMLHAVAPGAQSAAAQRRCAAHSLTEQYKAQLTALQLHVQPKAAAAPSTLSRCATRCCTAALPGMLIIHCIKLAQRPMLRQVSAVAAQAPCCVGNTVSCPAIGALRAARLTPVSAPVCKVEAQRQRKAGGPCSCAEQADSTNRIAKPIRFRLVNSVQLHRAC